MRLVLVGGGPAHLVVLEAAARGAFAGAELTLVSPHAKELVSAMVPGYIAGRYSIDDVTIDLARIARRIGAQFLEDGAKRIDGTAKVVHLESGAELRYDLASVAVGGVPTGLNLPGVAHHARFTKPVTKALELVPALEEAARNAGPEPLRVVVVGSGAAGVEAVLAVRARLDQLGATQAVIILIGAAHTVLHDRSRRAAALADQALDRAEITRRLTTGVEEVGADYVRVTGGKVLPADLILWIAGTDAPPLFRASGLPTDPRGFLLVEETLAVPETPGLFAAGDAVTLTTAPHLPKAGVHALRMGQVLATNLARAAQGKSLRSYRPESRFLTLLSTGDGQALLARGELAMQGRWVLALKHRRDRGLVRRFQRLYP
jgi:pyridine nucleotide-disulfide oxidoreductase family protein